MCVIFKTYNYCPNILDLSDILPNISFATSETEYLLLVKMVYTSCLRSIQIT